MHVAFENKMSYFKVITLSKKRIWSDKPALRQTVPSSPSMQGYGGNHKSLELGTPRKLTAQAGAL